MRIIIKKPNINKIPALSASLLHGLNPLIQIAQHQLLHVLPPVNEQRLDIVAHELYLRVAAEEVLHEVRDYAFQVDVLPLLS